jgi:hypothetical protein
MVIFRDVVTIDSVQIAVVVLTVYKQLRSFTLRTAYIAMTFQSYHAMSRYISFSLVNGYVK